MNRVRHITNQIRLHKRSPVICCVCDTKIPLVNSILNVFPKEVNLVVGNDLDSLRQNPLFCKSEAMIWLWVSDRDVFTQAFDELSGQIRWIHSYSAGVDKLSDFISTRLVNRPEVVLTNARGAYSSALAEYVLCAVLHFNKQIPRIMENRRKKQWDRFIMNVVGGKTMGMVGFGDIGVEVAKRAKNALGMRILALRRDPSKGDADGLADKVFGYKDRLELFRCSDVVVCSLPGTEDTQNFCGEEEFSAMRSSATFISIGRGTTVSESALYKALNSGGIANAALDVFQNEPLQNDSPLWELDNLLITAHSADYTCPDFKQGYEVWRKNYEAYCESRPLVTVVSKIHKY